MIKGLYTAAPGASILRGVADALAAETQGDLERLRSYTLFLPTRRAIRVLEETLLDAFALPTVLLPTITALGDIEIPPEDLDKTLPPPRSMEGIERIHSMLPFLEKHVPTPRRLEARWSMAQHMLQLIDLLQTEDLRVDDVARAAPADLAQHWQNNIGLFQKVAQEWLAHLKQNKRINAAAARTARIDALINVWQATPPAEPIWLLGSTGSIPAVRRLMRAALNLPHGAVLLPGVDLSLDDASWHAISDAHPQAILKKTLADLNYDRRELALWPAGHADPLVETRARYLSGSLSPNPAQGEPDARVALVECEHDQEEIDAIAQICADKLQQEPSLNIVVIGNDPALSARLTPLLSLYGIDSDTSAGYRVGDCSMGLLLCACIECLTQDAPVTLWSLLKNPSFYPAWHGTQRQNALSAIENAHLRDALKCPTEATALLALLDNDCSRMMRTAMENCRKDRSFAQWAVFLQELLAMFFQPRTASERACLDAMDDALQQFQAIRDAHALKAQDILPLLYDHMANLAYRLPQHAAPVTILGTMEARLMQADLTIIAGLNEGVWPDAPTPNPFLSRAMRHAIGLPDTERHSALSGHDFQQAFLNADVIMTRARQGADGPTLPARWLLQMQAVTSKESWRAMSERGQIWLSRLHAIHTPASVAPALPPAPLASYDDIKWPLSMSAVEKWRGDPFSFWASYVARLRALDPIMPDVDAAVRGTVWHEFFKRFVERFNPSAVPEEQLRQFKDAMHDTMAAFAIPEHKKRLWTARLTGAAEALIADEIERQSEGKPLHLEHTVEGTIDRYPLKARADRIDQGMNGLILYDYKTGQKPSKEDIRTGMKCQLSLLALIMDQSVQSLAYISIKGGRTPSETTQSAWDDTLEHDTERGFAAWCGLFLDGDHPFACHADFDDAAEKTARDYMHLARYQEWGGQS